MKNVRGTWLMGVFMAAITLLWSCESNDPAVAKAGIKFQAVTSQNVIDGARTEIVANQYTFTEVLLGVTEIEFETLEENDDEDSGDFEDEDDDGEDDSEEVEFEGSYTVDLINGTSTPDFGTTSLSSSVFEEVEVELGPVLADGSTVFVAFTFIPAGGGDPVTVEYSNDFELEFEIENESGFTLDNGLTSLLILFDLDALMSGVDISSAVADGDGVIRINASSNVSIADAIESNLDSVMDCGEDDDDDGEIDEDEDEDESEDD